MQASLFNPGGFQKEFHQLRIGHKVTLILISFMVLTSFGIIIPESWLVYFTLPLIFSGIALVHAVCAQRQYPVPKQGIAAARKRHVPLQFQKKLAAV